MILEDQPSLIYWGYFFNVDYMNNLWIADAYLSSIYYLSKEE